MELQGLIVEETQEKRTILKHMDGQVAQVKMVMRPASSAPEDTRIKCILGVPLEIDEDGEKKMVLAPMPYAQATCGGTGHNHEFRLEMN